MLLDINRYALIPTNAPNSERASVPSIDAALMRADEIGPGEYRLFSRASGAHEFAMIDVGQERIIMTLLPRGGPASPRPLPSALRLQPVPHDPGQRDMQRLARRGGDPQELERLRVDPSLRIGPNVRAVRASWRAAWLTFGAHRPNRAGNAAATATACTKIQASASARAVSPVNFVSS